jgi:hypothetical protein
MTTDDKAPAHTGTKSENSDQDSDDHDTRHLYASDVLTLLPDCSPFHDRADDAFITIEEQGSVHTLPIRSSGFDRWISAKCFREMGAAPAKALLEQVKTVLEGQALYEGETREVFVRVGHHDGKTYLDLGDPSGQAVEIDGQGWRPVSRPPVPFRRDRGFEALPMPEAEGSVYDLAPVLNLDGDELDLIVIYLLATLLPVGPYPVLYVSGEQGSAKSTVSRIIRSLIDPNLVPLRGDPREPRDLLVAAEHSWIVAMDNLSSMPKAVADGLCRLTSGTGQSVRQNYEDKGEVLFSATRPVLINGIPELVIRQDLADRTLRVDCQPISDLRRRSEEDVLRQFERIRPRVLGALLEGASMALRRKQAVKAASSSFGWESGKALGLMFDARSKARRQALQKDPIAQVLASFAADKAAFDPWCGTATELLEALEPYKNGTTLPSAPNTFSGQINDLIPALRDVGVLISKERVGHGSTRILKIRYAAVADDADSGA